MTKIHEFAKAGNTKAIKKEIKNYSEYKLDIVSEVNKKDIEGKTPLFIAVERNDMKTINVLLSVKGIDVSIADNNNVSPLHAAVKNNNIKAVFALLKQGANVDAADMQGKTPPFYAVDRLINTNAKNKAMDILLLLLLKNANVNIQNNEGDTLLHIAARNDNVKLLQLLLRFNADVKIENNNRSVSIELAALNRNKIIAAILAKRSLSEKKSDLRDGVEVKKLDDLDKIIKKIDKEIMKDISRISRKIIGKNLGGVTELSINILKDPLFPQPVSHHSSSTPVLYNPTAIISISPLSTHNSMKEMDDANNLYIETLFSSETIDPQQAEFVESTEAKEPSQGNSVTIPSSASLTNSSKPTIGLQNYTQQVAKIEVAPMRQAIVHSRDTNLANNQQPHINKKPENQQQPLEGATASYSSPTVKILSNSSPKVEPMSNHKNPMAKVNVREYCAFFSSKASQQQVKKPEVINASRLVQEAHKENHSSPVIEASRKLR